MLEKHNIYSIPVGDYFGCPKDACLLIYAPLKNKFFLSTPAERDNLEEQLAENRPSEFLKELTSPVETNSPEVSVDTFCTLHLLLNEKCNFHCQYCYSAAGRSTAELTMETIRPVLDYFLSSGRKAVSERTVMFMGGGEPVLSWSLLEEATDYAEQVAKEQGVNVHFSLTTNGSLMTDRMLDFLQEHHFTVQISFEILPDVQMKQRGSYDLVAENLIRLTDRGINNYVRSTITVENVDRIPEMVEYCHAHFPKVKKMSCQQVVDPDFFSSTQIVEDFFDRYFRSYQKGQQLAAQYGIELRSSSSHLVNYSKRERFCFNLLCLTPYGTLTLCPDVSSPVEPDYEKSVIGQVEGPGVTFNTTAFDRLACGNIHTIGKCQTCYARWNCGSGCPSSRRVYREEIFDSICDFYRKMLCNSLMEALAEKYAADTGRDLIRDITRKLSETKV